MITELLKSFLLWIVFQVDVQNKGRVQTGECYELMQRFISVKYKKNK